MNLSNGKIWPIAIGISIAGVFMMSIGTIVVTAKADIQKSDSYMTYYQDADAKANDYIQSKIAFDRKYSIAYLTPVISKKDSTLKFSVTDKMSKKSVESAKLTIAISRPETNTLNKTYTNPIYKDGIYSFNNIDFPKDGVWNIITKFEVDKDVRFLNIKVDTRNKKIKYFD